MSKVLNVSESKIEEILETPFNPPSFTSSFTEEDFGKEYWDVHHLLKSELLKLGTTDDWEDFEQDFTMNENLMESRGISVELNSKKMFSRKTVDSILRFLEALEQDYSVAVDHDLLDCEDFWFIFRRGQILVSCEDKKILRKFKIS